jgi:hypothetical protein
MADAGYAILCCLMFFNIGGGGGNHLLDFIPSDYYWKSKNIEMNDDTMLLQLQPPPAGEISALIAGLASDNPDERAVAARQLQAIGGPALAKLQAAAQGDDPGVATLAASLIGQINTAARPTAVRRLMAIRALGEMKDTDALVVLAKLVDSSEPMVSEYATRSIARIQDKHLPRDDPAIAAARRDDLALIPADAGAVGQASADVDDFPHDQLVKFINSAKLPQRPVPQAGGQGFVMQSPDPNKVRDQLLQNLLTMAERNGDIRFESVTFALADQVGANAGWGVIVFRGAYDSAALSAAMPNYLTPRDVNGTKVYIERHGGNFAVIPASDQRLIFIAGAKPDLLPIESITRAIKTGKGSFADDIALNKITRTVDTDSPLWVAANIGDCYRQAPVLTNMQSMTLVGTHNGKGLALRASGTCADAEQAQSASGALSAGVALICGLIRNNNAMGGNAASMADFLGGVKCEAKGTVMTATGTFTPAAAAEFLDPVVELASIPQPSEKVAAPPAAQP